MDFNLFNPVVGQSQAIQLLSQSIIQNRIAPAYLFVGTEGIGKTLTAECFAQSLLGTNRSQILNRNHPDLHWVEPTYLNNGQRLTVKQAQEINFTRKSSPLIRLEQIRELTEFLSRSPWESTRQVVIIESAQSMAESAANALLKTLEEPGNATIILIAPSIDSILSTLVSRCQRIPFYPLSHQDLTTVLNRTGNQELLKDQTIIDMAAGSPGNAIAMHRIKTLTGDFIDSILGEPVSYLEAFLKAGRVVNNLDTEAQLWLVDYLQHYYWKQSKEIQKVEQLEQTRKRLMSHAQPRLVWECTFLNMLA